MSKQQLIEILTVPGCMSKKPTRAMVDSLLKKHGLQAFKIREIVIKTPEQARREKFPGSPTVRVEGIDIEPMVEQQTNYGMG